MRLAQKEHAACARAALLVRLVVGISRVSVARSDDCGDARAQRKMKLALRLCGASASSRRGNCCLCLAEACRDRWRPLTRAHDHGLHCPEQERGLGCQKRRSACVLLSFKRNRLG